MTAIKNHVYDERNMVRVKFRSDQKNNNLKAARVYYILVENFLSR